MQRQTCGYSGVRKEWDNGESSLDIYTVEYYSAIQRDEFESVELRWTNLKSVTQSEGSQKEKSKYSVLLYEYGI